MQRVLTREMPLLMGKSGTLFGVLTQADPAREIGVLILNSGLLHNVGPFRLHVLLGRLLGERGFTTARLDQSGKGESSARPDKAYANSILDDYDDAFSLLQHHGVSRTVLVGLCSGADDALHIASARGSVAGIVMLDGYAPKGADHTLHHYLPRIGKLDVWLRFFGRLLGRRHVYVDNPTVSLALSLRNWKSQPEMLADIGALLTRGTRMMAVFTGGVEDYYNHRGQLSKRFPAFASNGQLQEEYFPKAEHIYVTVRHRERLLERLERWFTETFPKDPANRDTPSTAPRQI